MRALVLHGSLVQREKANGQTFFKNKQLSMDSLFIQARYFRKIPTGHVTSGECNQFLRFQSKK
jgi:hypothetical protein